MHSIIRLDLLISNAYLLGTGRRRVLIDTGADFAYGRLRKKLDAHGVKPGDVSLVILTHAHPDHAGNAARLKRDFGTEIAVHAAEADWLRTGTTELYQPCGVVGHILDRVISRKFEPCKVDRELQGNETISIAPDAAPLSILHTPGHTPGHVCVACAGRDLFAGDLMRGGVFCGEFVGPPFFVQDRHQLAASIAAVRQRGADRLHFGHGRPASGAAFARTNLP